MFEQPITIGSALVGKLEHYVVLTPDERAAIDWLERSRRRFNAGDVLVEEGEPTDRFWVVRQGWLHCSSRLPSGDRQILRLHFPGDVMNTSNVAWAAVSATITAATSCVVSDFPRAGLGRIFGRHPRLAALFYALSSVENVVLADRLGSLGREDGLARVSRLLLEILSRLRITEPGLDRSFELDLTQTDIGDAVGLTKVHVNRTLREMDERGLIARSGRTVTILDERAMTVLCEFKDRHREIATDWLPQVA